MCMCIDVHMDAHMASHILESCFVVVYGFDFSG